MLGVVKAAPQARPKTTWREGYMLRSAWVYTHDGCNVNNMDYLKRAWDNDLKFERASRSLAKTGFCFAEFLQSFTRFWAKIKTLN